MAGVLGKYQMKGFGLSDAEVSDLLNYVRNSFSIERRKDQYYSHNHKSTGKEKIFFHENYFRLIYEYVFYKI